MKTVTGSIQQIRMLEDCIRATSRYTEGIFTEQKEHPIQGKEFASKAFCKVYEVYPDNEIPTFDSSIADLGNFLSNIRKLTVKFFYDYRSNKATVKTENNGIDVLEKVIPHFKRFVVAIYSRTEYVKEEAK